jgi:2-oxoglutarate/2-oxoacid ferredoxin oxidoreductase subunit beta
LAVDADFIPSRDEIRGQQIPGALTEVKFHDGAAVRFRAVPPGYDPRDRRAVEAYLLEHSGHSEIVTGLLYLDESVPDLHELNETPEEPLQSLTHERLCPGAAGLARFQAHLR